MFVDEELKSLIETTIFNDPRLSSQRIEVSPAAGHVTLEGTVQSFRRKLLAQQIVSSFDGVHRVTNQLVVTPSEPVPDDEIAKNVRAALDSSADVTKSSIQVSVTGGKVTLQGAVSSVWEQAVADDVVRGVRGVRKVINLLIVNLQDKVADEELANSISAAFHRTRGLTKADLGVAVAGKTITLSGQVAELWQREIAESVVRGFGLMHIRNEIDVNANGAGPV